MNGVPHFLNNIYWSALTATSLMSLADMLIVYVLILWGNKIIQLFIQRIDTSAKACLWQIKECQINEDI